MGDPLLVLRVFFCCVCLSVCFVYCSTVSGDHFFSEPKNTRGDADQVADIRKRRASTFLPINPLKTANINNTWFGRIENALGYI